MGSAAKKSLTLSEIARAAHPLAFADPAEYDPLLEQIGDARLVLIGEASHGTHEFYRERARITRRLISGKNFAAVAAEADWPDAWLVNQFVRGQLPDEGQPQVTDPIDALRGFRRFPAWMWRNMDVLAFVDWLRHHNAASNRPAGFYGLDLYSLYTSAQEVLRFLDAHDPAAAARARFRYSCFDQFGEDTQAYGYAAGFGMTESCEHAVLDQLLDLEHRSLELQSRDGHLLRSDLFSANENATVVRDAERYYRTMFGGRVSSWNLRDRHMADTLDRLLDHLGPESKVIVWAHNSHLGDARATEMGHIGEINLGQLVREHYDRDAFLLGFTTYSGEVTAASNWDEPAERKIVRRALPNSVESLFHETGIGDFLLPLRPEAMRAALAQPLLERAIGVIYKPESERISHYFEARLPEQFDAVIHIDRTRALIPLETTITWHEGEEVPETYPSTV
ncbi:MAG TPA: erythromycin esterase family protein [Acidobacteriaceae bacterium]|jgi:erythromycin esterase-like protein|nr:erythromycin esterase family protein [Acidobacteriaceae bacterium]